MKIDKEKNIDKVLIVGLGSIGQRHLRIAREQLPYADIRVLRRHRTNLVPEYSDGCFATLDEALSFAPDIAVIASPAPFHIEIAQRLAEARVHLLIEKPISHTTKGVLNLIDCCQKNKITLLIGYNLRFLKSLQHFRNLIKEGAIGKVLSVRCEIGQYLPSWRPESDYRNGVTAQRELGGGALLELSHEIDYLLWIFGAVNWVIASATKQSLLDIDVEDTVHLILGFSTDKPEYELICNVNIDLIRHDTTRFCLVIGNEASLKWDAISGKISIYKQVENSWSDIYDCESLRDDSYKAEWSHFIDCFMGDANSFIPGIDSFNVLQVIDAARLSSANGCRVEMPRLN